MGDMGDYWQDVRPAMIKESQRKRASNRAYSALTLSNLGVVFESRNDGAHLIVQGLSSVIDYWPGTGLWRERGSVATGRGVKSLVARAQKPKRQETK